MGIKIYFNEQIAESSVEKISFDSELWEIYRGAGGNIKEQLMSLINGTGDFEEMSECVFEEISHQMSFYKATYLVLPYLTELLAEKEKENDFQGQMNLISRVGICLGTDVKWMNTQKGDETVMVFYNKAKEILKEKTKRFINTYENEIIESDEEMKSMFITALPAIFGNPEFTFLMTMNYWEECSVCCSECEYMDEGIEIEDDELDIEKAEDVLGKWNGKDFKDTYLWYSNILAIIDKSYLEKLKLYFGTYTCPECGKSEKVISFMKDYYILG